MIGLGSIATTFNPYLLYIKIALVVLLVAGLAWIGWHEKSIRADLDKYKAEAALQKASAEMYAQQFNSYIQLNKEIADAIKKVRVQSNTYIDSVEVSQPPVADGDNFVLIPAGVSKAVPASNVPGYKNYSAGRTGAAPS
jgi:hypothetical protein